MHSANSVSAPVAVSASATCRQRVDTAADTVMDIIRSDCSTNCSIVGTFRMPAFSAKARVRSLRPSKQVITSSSFSRRRWPTAWPMSPGLKIATVLISMNASLGSGMGSQTTSRDSCILRGRQFQQTGNWESGHRRKCQTLSWVPRMDRENKRRSLSQVRQARQ